MKHLFWAVVILGATFLLSCAISNISVSVTRVYTQTLTAPNAKMDDVNVEHMVRPKYFYVDHYEKGAVGIMVKDADGSIVSNSTIYATKEE